MTPEQIAAEINRAERRIAWLRAKTPEAEPTCSICGALDDYLVPVQVVTNRGEEGHADVTQMLCELHVNAVMEHLTRLGFADHRHGGIDFLEDETCPGRDDPDACPTPTEYGPVLIQPDGPRNVD